MGSMPTEHASRLYSAVSAHMSLSWATPRLARWPPPRSRARRRRRNPRPAPSTLPAASIGRGTAVWRAGTAAGAPGAPQCTPPPAQRRRASMHELHTALQRRSPPPPRAPRRQRQTADRQSSRPALWCARSWCGCTVLSTVRPASKGPPRRRHIHRQGSRGVVHQLGVSIVHRAACRAHRPPLPLAYRDPHLERRAALPAEPHSRVALRHTSA